MKKILFLFCALSLFIGSLFSGLVYASGSRSIPQDNFSRPSKSYDVGMMFYKMVGAVPQFDPWIEGSTAYKAMTPEQQAQFKITEKLRLQQAFANLDMKKAAVVIRTVVKAEVVTKPATGPGEPAKHVLKLDLPPAGELYFPYTVGDQTIAVIPNGVDLYREIPLIPAEATAIKSRLDVTGKTTLVLEIAPKMADGTKPMVMNGTPQWLLVGEIGFLGIYNSYTDVLWSYHAPYYVMQGQDALLNLRSNSLVPFKPGDKNPPAATK